MVPQRKNPLITRLSCEHRRGKSIRVCETNNSSKIKANHYYYKDDVDDNNVGVWFTG